MNYLDSNKLRQVAFIAILLILGTILFIELSSFIPALLGAVTFYVLVRSQMAFLVGKKHWRKPWAATIVLLLTFLVVLVPIWVMVTMLSSRINYAVQHSNQVIEALKNLIGRLQQQYDIHLLSGENLSKAGTIIAGSLPNVLGATFNTLTMLLIMYFILYFMLVNYDTMEQWLFTHMPLKTSNKIRMGKELKGLVISNALGVPLIALLQGIVGLVAYFFLGVKDPWFWFMVTCITSMLPFVGAAMAYVPLSILLFVQEPAWKGIVMLIYGFGVIGTVDNLFRIVLQRKIGDIHPLITLFGVIIGVNMFGFIGLIFGPILIAMFILLVRIYFNEFSNSGEL
ncbi:AI-2E family transporter [Deminuibacter soli]|uniref:AI-2E family transporter n=1 Tax=Deminuibacter soli TaxID=2291815 RepID=A0A3E1NPV6_9BACT|nr:AI-2E family transporter [Deminuibacter soli]RFM29961.1 AI-2E family transporter [Deminuibacter soli]